MANVPGLQRDGAVVSQLRAAEPPRGWLGQCQGQKK